MGFRSEPSGYPHASSICSYDVVRLPGRHRRRPLPGHSMDTFLLKGRPGYPLQRGEQCWRILLSVSGWLASGRRSHWWCWRSNFKDIPKNRRQFPGSHVFPRRLVYAPEPRVLCVYLRHSHWGTAGASAVAGACSLSSLGQLLTEVFQVPEEGALIPGLGAGPALRSSREEGKGVVMSWFSRSWVARQC